MENTLKKEFWRQFLAAVFRKFLFMIGGILEAYGFISHSQNEGFSSLEVALYLAGFAFQVAPVLWQAAKTKFDVIFNRAAYCANPDEVRLSVVKNEVLTNETKVTSI